MSEPIDAMTKDKDIEEARDWMLDRVQEKFGVSPDEALAILFEGAPPPGTLAAAGRDLDEALRRLALEIAYALRLDQLADWLAKQLRRFQSDSTD